MSPFSAYLLQSALSLSILVIAYKLLFSRQAAFTLNRIFLLLIIVYGFVGSIFSNFLINKFFITDAGLPDSRLTGKIPAIDLREITIDLQPVNDLLNSSHVLLIIYFSGILFMFLKLLFNFIKIVNLYLFSEKKKTAFYTVVLLEKNIPPFSFFNMLFIPKILFSDNGHYRKIIIHEEVHIKQNHSIDILLAEILKIFQWFNPFVYILKDAITENHEYLADRVTIAVTKEMSDYKVLILSAYMQQRTSNLTNNFSYSLIKKRIKMMEKQKSKFKMTVSVLGFLIILAAVTVSCSQKNEPDVAVKPTEQVVQPDNPKLPVADKNQQQENDSVYVVVEEMPEFPGGVKALMKYLKENINYPDAAKEQKIQGRVYINFIIEKDGTVSNVNILRGIGGGCNEEAVRVVKSMPKWTPGKQNGKPVRVDFNLPVKFVMN